MYCRDRFALGNKKPVLTAVHPAYACEATTAKERGRKIEFVPRVTVNGRGQSSAHHTVSRNKVA